jgi:uncharacterized membrane protein YphA (DoxX/SURF4 family)
MKYVIWALRIIIGVLFIFSGVVKANDPLGLAYKMNEFFEVWGWNFMVKYSLGLSVTMIAFEIACGVAMLVGNAFRLWVTLLLLLNIFFTFLTAYALFSGKIKECGCFGDCIKISPANTFYKDIVLTVMAFVLYIFRYRVFPLFNKAAINFSIVLASLLFAFGIQWWTLHHLPVHDCLAYKPGNNILEKTQPAPNATEPVYETIFVYEKNGIKKEFTAENYPWQDTTWKFVSSNSKLIKEGTGQPEIHDFVLTDDQEADVTEQVLKTKGYMFLWFLREPSTADTKHMDRLHALIDKAKAMHIPFYVLCSAGRDICKTYQEAWNLKDVPFYILDVTVSKTAIRTNPGLMLLKDGTVVDKWSYLDYPKDIVMDNGKLETKQ